MVPDEGRYSEIPREMAASGDYLTPRLNGLKYFEKPPLFYWLEATSIKYLGFNEGWLRIVPALLGLLGCLVLYVAARILYNRRSAVLASMILASSGLYYLMSHTITPDIALSLFLSASLLCFVIGTSQISSQRRLYSMLGMYLFAGLAVLTKGLVAILFPAMIIGLWICLCHKWKDLRSYFPMSGLLLFFAISVPWHLLVQLKNPEFAHFYFIEQHFMRYLTNYADRGQPFWFMSAVTLLGFFPWTIFLLSAPLALKQEKSLSNWLTGIWQQRQTQQTTLFLLVWAISIGLFFSFSHSQLLSYALPIIPALALLLGRYFDLYAQNNVSVIRWNFIAMLLIGIIGSGIVLFFVKGQNPFYWHLSLSLLLATLVSAVLLPRQGIYIFMLGFTLAYACLNASHSDQRSIKPLAMEIKTHAQGNEPVVAYQYYYQDLPVYLQHIVQVVDYQGELAFGLKHQGQQDWMIKRDTFWRNWQKPQRMFMIMSLFDYNLVHYYHPNGDLTLYPMKKTLNHILVTNHPL